MKTQQWKGHVQTAFELRTGRTLTDWLLEHGPTMTRKAAADEIGYASPEALKQYVERYLPAEFKFYRRPPYFSVEEVEAALIRRKNNEPWRQIALSYGRDINLLIDACRRYKKREHEKDE